MNEPASGEPRLNPDGETGTAKSGKEAAQEIAHKAAESTKRAARATGKSLWNVFKIWAGIAPDPVARSPQAVGQISASDAWQSLAWVALFYALTLPRIEYRMLPLLMRTSHTWFAYAFHAVALCVGITAAAFAFARLFGGKTSIEKCAFAVSLALLPQWITLTVGGLFADWTRGWAFAVIGFGTCVAILMLNAVFTRAFGLSDRQATLAVPLVLGVGGGVAYYIGKVAS